MQISLSTASNRISWQQSLAWSAAFLLVGMLWLPEGRALWAGWRNDDALSHGPFIPLIVIGLLWQRRDRLRCWTAAAMPGLLGLLLTGLLYVAAVWADVDFL